jgi:DNA-binding MarR family transcriptional regulator
MSTTAAGQAPSGRVAGRTLNEMASISGLRWVFCTAAMELTGPMTPGELGARTGLTTGPTTRLIDRLAEAGYVTRAPDPHDRRKVVVVPVGKPARLDEVMAPARQKIGEILATFTPEQLDTLFDYFRRAADAYQEAGEQARAAQPGRPA